MAKQFELPYQTWERVTGLSWSEAKKRGYTDGSADKNLALKESLMNGEWDNMQAMQQAPYKGGTKEPMSEGSIVETLSGAPYKGAIGVPYGANATEEDIATQSEMMSKPMNTGKKKFTSTAKKDTFIDESNAKKVEREKAKGIGILQSNGAGWREDGRYLEETEDEKFIRFSYSEGYQDLLTIPPDKARKVYYKLWNKNISNNKFKDHGFQSYENAYNMFNSDIRNPSVINATLKKLGYSERVPESTQQRIKKPLSKSTDGRIYVDGFKPAPGIQYPKKQKVSYRTGGAEKTKAFAKKTRSTAKKASQRPWEYLRFD